MIRTQISMTVEQAEGLRRLAAIRRRSQAALVREALDDLLGAGVRQRNADAALAVLGAFSSGGGDAATDHDAELEEAYAT